MVPSYETGCPEWDDTTEQNEVVGKVTDVRPNSKFLFVDASGDHKDESESVCYAENVRCKYDHPRVFDSDVVLNHMTHDLPPLLGFFNSMFLGIYIRGVRH